MSEMETLRQQMQTIERNVNAQFKGVRTDLKELATALRELVKMDGDIRVMREALGRVGRESEDHESRLRTLELKSGNRFDRLIDRVLTAGVGGVVTWAVLRAVGG